MTVFRKLFCIIAACLLLAGISVQAVAAEDSEAYIQRMIQYYLRFQENADAEIGVLLDYLTQTDPQQGELWRKIMVSWAYTNSQMTLEENILPDGLMQDDSLCIVIMGYGLNRDGSMREELIDRLVVGLSSALKYPNAYVVVTGGATSGIRGITEAGQMAAWLMARGVSQERLIVENKSYSTLQNVKKVYSLLAANYPQITHMAVVTSDYHIRQSCILFAVQGHYDASVSGRPPIKLVGNAVVNTGERWNDLYAQAKDICAITGIPFRAKPAVQPELSE